MSNEGVIYSPALIYRRAYEKLLATVDNHLGKPDNRSPRDAALAESVDQIVASTNVDFKRREEYFSTEKDPSFGTDYYESVVRAQSLIPPRHQPLLFGGDN